ncbi:MAG TPA: lanthionine synthetase LanC family protein, partial [Chloroflexota bacterium]|nr:lanthionine synthetase LanC family protein [Chloroflexota bacterium]
MTATHKETGRSGAESVYAYIQRTAEEGPHGVRWQTMDWENQPQYDLSIFYGTAGIVLFLADYHRLTGNERSLELALGAARWCSQPERLQEGSVEEWRQDGLLRGRAGVGYAWLRLSQATGDRRLLGEASSIAGDLLRKTPGPVTDWLDGATGEGIFLLRLAQASGEQRFLDGAIRVGEWLTSVAIRDEQGLYWPWQVDDPEHGQWFGLSFVPGMAGIAHFLLSLYQETRDTRWASIAREAAQTLQRQAVPDHGGLNWPDTLDGVQHGEDLRCQWCNGAPGVGLFFVKAYETLGEPENLTIAEAAGEATFQYGDVRKNAVQCHGMAGNADLFLDLYRACEAPERKQFWLKRAHDFGQRMFSYRSTMTEGDVWQADDPGVSSPDYMMG